MKKLLILIGLMLVLALMVTPASAIVGEGFDAAANNLVVAGDPGPTGLANNQSECTLGVNHASITTHDSPVLWRVRDNPDSWLRDYPGICYTVQHYFGVEYDEIELDYIAMVHHDDRPVPIHVHGFGLNEAGVGTGQTLVRNESYDYNKAINYACGVSCSTVRVRTSTSVRNVTGSYYGL